MKIDVRTPDGQPMTWKQATLPLGSALRIAPAFQATAVAEDISVETTIEADYIPAAGGYRVTATTHRAVAPTTEITPTVLRQVRLGEVLSAAVPYCVVVELDGTPVTVHDLTASEGRILPAWMAAASTKAGPTPDTLELLHLVYGVAALAAQPPMRAVATEFSIPERTATHWIAKARRAGLLDGITYAVGRQPDRNRRTGQRPAESAVD